MSTGEIGTCSRSSLPFSKRTLAHLDGHPVHTRTIWVCCRKNYVCQKDGYYIRGSRNNARIGLRTSENPDQILGPAANSRSPNNVLWMERAWTFNEGLLSRSCCFQFADEIVDSKTILDIQMGVLPRALSKRLRCLVELDLSTYCLSELSRGWNYWPSSLNSDSGMFINGWNALGCRSTTQPEDLLVILANLQGVNLSQLSRFRPEERLAVLISYQHRIPFTFLTSSKQSKYPVSHSL